MVHAYVMVRTAAGASQDVLPVLEGLDGVTEAHVVAGKHDVIVEFEVPDTAGLLSRVTSEIQHVEGVEETRTYIALD